MTGSSNQIKYFQFKNLLLSNEWRHAVYVGVDDAGIIDSISSDRPSKGEIEVIDGIVLPGFQNCHSHAFQYVMAGMAEIHDKNTNDDFWSWRELMYQCALSFDPDQVQTVATALYIQMLKNGFTSVAEFHYLHHDKNGKPYSNTAEISISLLAAAALAGIRITLIPVYYQKGGFGMDPLPRQKRFVFNNTESYLELWERASSAAGKITTAKMGMGVHSLRAASVNDLLELNNASRQNIPFHLHAAEQLKEVEDCVSHLKARPVQWLLQNLPLNERHHLVHCTHLNDEEVKGLAKSKANVILCPGTEGNLGDGIFRLTDFHQHQGRWCIGTDSHVSLNPLEDLRWLDYAQRLTTHKRNTFYDGGLTMIRQTYFNGTQAMGESRTDFFEVGKPLDAVVYRGDDMILSGTQSKDLLPRILFNCDRNTVLGTIVNGKWIVKEGFHHEEARIRQLFKKVLGTLSL